MAKKEQEIWLIAEQLKSLEKQKREGFLQYVRLERKYQELTGMKWQNKKGEIINA